MMVLRTSAGTELLSALLGEQFWKYSKTGIDLAGVYTNVIRLKRQALQKQVNGYNSVTAKKQSTRTASSTYVGGWDLRCLGFYSA